MQNAKKYMELPNPVLIKTYICEGCNRNVEQKELVIPLGPRKGERIIGNYGCICEDIELAKQAKDEYKKLQNKKVKESFSYYSLINKSLKLATLENFEASTDELLLIKKKASDFINTFNGKQNLLFTGGYGTGKSHLSISITKKIMEKGYECLFLSLPKLLTKIKQTYNNGQMTEDELLEVIKRVDLLVLDDIGAEFPTMWASSKLFEILDDRSGKATIYTTNLRSSELLEKVNERNFSRMMDNTTVIAMNGGDYRRKTF